jgi:multiple sugar transport system substrate-binding protein
MNRRRSAVGAVVIVGALLMSGCSGTGNGSSSSGGSTTLDWVIWGNTPPEIESANHVAGLVNKSDPAITVKAQTMSWPDYWTKLPTTLSGASTPCLVSMQMGHVREFADQLLPLTDAMFKSASVNTADFDPGIMNALQVDGKQLAIPYDLGPIIMYYNKDMFKAAGVPDPKNGWTTDEFMAAAKTLTSGGKYGFSMDNTIEAMEQWAPTLAGKLPVTDAGVLDVNNPDITSALTWYGNLVNKEKVAAPVIASPASTASVAFLGGTAAMYTDGPWAMINNKAQAKFNMGVVTVPAGPHGVTGPIEGSGYGISKKCSNPDAAMKALAVITGPDSLAYMGGQGRAFPARTAQQSTWYKNAVEGSQPTLEAAMAGGIPFRSTKNWTQDGLNWTQGVVSVINGDSPVAPFLKSVQDHSSGQ